MYSLGFCDWVFVLSGPLNVAGEGEKNTLISPYGIAGRIE